MLLKISLVRYTFYISLTRNKYYGGVATVIHHLLEDGDVKVYSHQIKLIK